MEKSEIRFVTIREAAKAVGLSHALIRQFVKRGQVPGFYNGDRYYVNLPAFIDALEAGAVGDRPATLEDKDEGEG